MVVHRERTWRATPVRPEITGAGATAAGQGTGQPQQPQAEKPKQAQSGPETHYAGDLFSEIQRYATLASEIARQEQFDVVHAHDWMTFPAGLAVAGISGKPLVVHVHSTEFDRAGMNIDTRIYDIERRGMQGAMKVIAVSYLTKTLLGDGGRLDPEKTSPEQLSQIERIAIEFDDVWFDQRDQYYFYKPARLYTRLSLAVPGKIRRQPQHLHPFLDWIFSEAGRLRVEQKNRPSDERTWTLSAPWVELAHQCRMTRQLEHRNYKRVQATLKESAELARTAQIITGYACDGGETFSITFDHRIFKDLDDYLEKQRDKQRRRCRAEASDATSSASPQLPGTRRRPTLWRDPAQLSLNDINKLIDEHKEAVKRIQGRITSVYDHAQGWNVPSRPFTPDEEDVLDAHRERIEFLTELKLGVRPLSPSSRGFTNEASGGY